MANSNIFLKIYSLEANTEKLTVPQRNLIKDNN